MILIINGPNLNLLGRREPEIYGSVSFEDYLEKLSGLYTGEEIEYFQSNSEGELINAVQRGSIDSRCTGIIINPGGYSHYSVAIADAVAAAGKPVVEVHISNIHARESYRQRSITATKASGVIAGFGLEGYALAIEALQRLVTRHDA